MPSRQTTHSFQLRVREQPIWWIPLFLSLEAVQLVFRLLSLMFSTPVKLLHDAKHAMQRRHRIAESEKLLPRDLSICKLQEAYISGSLTPEAVCEVLLSRIEKAEKDHIWIYVLNEEEVQAQTEELSRIRKEFGEEATLELVLEKYPLYGIPFAVKDNMDVKGLPTTAACPAFKHIPEKTAALVRLAQDAGAILLGKTNMDQFACGLVGTRSAYGSPTSAFDKNYIPGGSSSGSALAVTKHQVCFSFGTDTAGSGRVPAAFGNIVGLKPSNGVDSMVGVLPAARTIDCPSIFSYNVSDAYAVLKTIAKFDPNDAFCCHIDPIRSFPDIYFLSADKIQEGTHFASFKFAVPNGKHLNFFGDDESGEIFEAAVEQIQKLGGILDEKIDFEPITEIGSLAYNSGMFVTERFLSIKDFFTSSADQIVEPTRKLIEEYKGYTAAEMFEQYYKLRELRRQVELIFKKVDILVVPTVPRHYTFHEEHGTPMKVTKELATFTAFANLAGLPAISIPNGFKKPLERNGHRLPVGVSFVGPSMRDELVVRLAHLFQMSTRAKSSRQGSMDEGHRAELISET